MKIYTKTGDQGETGLFAGPRVYKDDVRIEAYGEVDELNAFLGQALTLSLPSECGEVLQDVQHCLFAVGAELATPDPQGAGTAFAADQPAERLERAIDKMESELEPLKQFILPGGTPQAASLHIARSVCRRAERRVVTLSRTPGVHVSAGVLLYLNRISDLLFVMARYANSVAQFPDVPWQKPQ